MSRQVLIGTVGVKGINVNPLEIEARKAGLFLVRSAPNLGG
jgi:hypothetical protein